MFFDPQNTPQVLTARLARARQQAVYRSAQRAGRPAHKPRNVADVLERGHRSHKADGHTALLVDVTV